MKRLTCIVLSIILALSLTIYKPVEVKASTITNVVELWTWINALREVDGQDFSIKGFIQSAFHTVGLVTPWDANYPTLEEYMKTQTANDKGVDVSEVTDRDVYNYIDNRISNVTYDSCKIGSDLNADIKYMANLLQSEQTMYVGYSLDLRYYDNGYMTSFIQNEIMPNQDSYMYFYLLWSGQGPHSRVLKVDKTKCSMVNVSRTSPYSNVNLYNNLTFSNDVKSFSKLFRIETDGTYTELDINNSDVLNPTLRVMNENYSYRADDYNPYFNNNQVLYMLNSTLVSYGKVYSYQIFGNYTLFTQSERGEAPYYIDNSVYSNWQNSTGDYTVNTDNSNHVSYGDITSYIDSFNTKYGNNPSPTDITQYIKDKNYEIINNGPGGNGGQGGQGGSGGSSSSSAIANNEGINITINNNHSLNLGSGLSGNTVSGNGNSSVSNIFDWLGNLGNITGQFVKNVGEMIVNALQGIGEAITTILEGIPNILTPLIEFVFGGLPEELQALITLGITCVIFVGVIKAIKR